LSTKINITDSDPVFVKINISEFRVLFMPIPCHYSIISSFPHATFSENFILKQKKGEKTGGKEVEKRAFLNRKSGKMGVLSVNFILTPTVECGLEVGVLGEVYYGCTKNCLTKKYSC